MLALTEFERWKCPEFNYTLSEAANIMNRTSGINQL